MMHWFSACFLLVPSRLTSRRVRRLTSRGVSLLGTLSLISMTTLGVGLGGCQEKRSSQCDFPFSVRLLIWSSLDETRLSPEDRSILMSHMLAHCEGWPDFLMPYIEVLKEGPHQIAENLMSRRDELFSDQNLKGARRYLDSICPGYSKRFPTQAFAWMDHRGPGREYREIAKEIYRYCHYSRLRVLDEKEFANHAGTWIVVLYTALQRMGMKPGAARLLSRLWLPMESELERRLPASTSETQMVENGPRVMVSSELVLVDSGAILQLNDKQRVPADLKRDGPDGFFITPLFYRLRDRAKSMKAHQETRGEVNNRGAVPPSQGSLASPGNLILEMDGGLSYRLMMEVLYTAAQAGFRTTQIRVQSPELTNQVVLIEDLGGVTTERSSADGYEALNLTVTVSESGYHVKSRHGDECPESEHQPKGPCFAVERGGRVAALKKLAHHMWYLWANRYAKPELWNNDPVLRSTFHIAPADKTTLSEVVRVLDALRDIPRDAITPPVPPRLPKTGCFFVFDTKSGQWSVPKKSAPACMFPHVVLGF